MIYKFILRSFSLRSISNYHLIQKMCQILRNFREKTFLQLNEERKGRFCNRMGREMFFSSKDSRKGNNIIDKREMTKF